MNQAQQIKVIAIDLDGTLLNSQKEVSKANKQAIKKAREAGIKIVLCTGRPLKGIAHLLEELDLLQEGDLSINYNGGVIQETKSKRLIYQATLTKEECMYVYQCGMDVELPSVLIDLEYVYEPPYPKDAPSLYPQLMKLLTFKSINLDELSDDAQMNKMLFCLDQERLDARIQQLPSEFFERFSVVKSRPVALEITPKGVNKGDGLERLAEHLSISMDQIMACGDEANDLEMIQAAGIGVAMGNAVDSIKAIATFVTDTNDRDGVAKAIEHAIALNQQ